MGTFSKTYLKTENLEVVKKAIGKYYKIVTEEVDRIEQDYKFFQNGSDTIILSKNYNENWVEIILNFPFTLYYHDELLRRISEDLETEILLGYYQSTIVEGRLAKFNKGKMEISILQGYVKYKENSGTKLFDSWGITDEIRDKFFIPKIAEEYFEIDHDLIFQFYKMNGLEWDGKERDEVYHHLEIKYE